MNTNESFDILHIDPEPTYKQRCKHMKFSIGDVVRLKSGGPEMVILSAHVSVKGQWSCRWFDFRGKEMFDCFPPEGLDLVRPATPLQPEPIGRTPGKWYIGGDGHVWTDAEDSSGCPMIVAYEPNEAGKEDVACWPANARWICQIPKIERLINTIRSPIWHIADVEKLAGEIYESVNGK